MKEELKRLCIQATAEVEPPWPGEWRKLVEIRSTTTLKLTKRKDFGFLRSSTWVCLGKIFCRWQLSFLDILDIIILCNKKQFYSRRVSWGIGPRLHNVHVNSYVIPCAGCARQISQRTKEVLQFQWKTCKFSNLISDLRQTKALGQRSRIQMVRRCVEVGVWCSSPGQLEIPSGSAVGIEELILGTSILADITDQTKGNPEKDAEFVLNIDKVHHYLDTLDFSA